MSERARSARAKPKGSSLVAAAEALGIAKPTLMEHDAKGRVVRYPDRSVDVEATRIRIDTLKDPRGGNRTPTAPVADVNDVLRALDDLATLTDMERRKRLDIAKIILTENQAEGERLKVEVAKSNLVPLSEAEKVVESATRLIQSTLDAAVESGAMDLNAAHAVPLAAARVFLRSWYRECLSHCAAKMRQEGLES